MSNTITKNEKRREKMKGAEKKEKVEVKFEDGNAVVYVDGVVKMIFPEEMVEISPKKDGVPLSEVLKALV